MPCLLMCLAHSRGLHVLAKVLPALGELPYIFVVLLVEDEKDMMGLRVEGHCAGADVEVDIVAEAHVAVDSIEVQALDLRLLAAVLRLGFLSLYHLVFVVPGV